MARTYIGLSGWSYKEWRGDFYPEDLPRREELAYLSRRFNSLEVNGTFYSLQRPETFLSWYEATPRDFVFAVKGSQYITHRRRLRDPETPLANFFAQGVLRLGEKLGPILWQLPARFGLDMERLDAFLDRLPGDTRAAAELARRHDHRLEGRAWTEIDARHRLRHALEVRSDEALTPELVRTLRRHGVALVFSHSGGWPYVEEVTAGFVYLRLHGKPETYASPYDDDDLDRWSARIRRWTAAEEPSDAVRITDRKPPARKGRDLYVYFDNDARGHAPRDALRLAERVAPDPSPEVRAEEAVRGRGRGSGSG